MPFGTMSNGPPTYGSAARRGRLGNGDPVVDALREDAPERPSERVPAKPLTGRMAGGDDRARGRRERERGEDRSERLVHVDDVERFPLPDPLHPHHRLRAEDDVGERGVGRDDDRAAHGDDVVGRSRVPSLLRVQKPREPARGVVAHDDARVVPEPAQRARLVVGVLLDSAPERPGVRNDDARPSRPKPYPSRPIRLASVIKRAKRLDPIRGFGIDRVAAAVGPARPGEPRLACPPHGEPGHQPAAAAGGDRRHGPQSGDAGGEQLAALHGRPAPPRGDRRLPRRPHRASVRPRARDRHHLRRHGRAPERAPRNGRPGRRGRRHRSDLRRHRQPRPPRRRHSEAGAVPGHRGRVAARPRRAGRVHRREDDGHAAHEPVDALRRHVRRGGLAARLRPLPRARPLPRLRLCDGAPPLRRKAARASAPFRRHGRAHDRRRLALEGAPHDRLAGRLGRRPRRDNRGRGLGARLQHDRACRPRSRRGGGRAARPAGTRRRVRRRARAPARHDARTGSPTGRSSDPAAAGPCSWTSPSSASRRPPPRGTCSRRARSRRRRWSAGAARSPNATSASSSAPSPSTS